MSSIDAEIADILERRKGALANAATTCCWNAAPELGRCAGDRCPKCIGKVFSDVAYLANAVAVSCPELFTDYVTWEADRLQGQGGRVTDFRNRLNALRLALQQELPIEAYEVIKSYLAPERHARTSASPHPESVPEASKALHELAGRYLNTLLDGDMHAAAYLITDAVEAGASVPDIYLHVLQPSQHEIGRLWQTNRIDVAHEHQFTSTTQLVMASIVAQSGRSNHNGRTVVAACVRGELHEIGCRMLADLFEIDGWNAYFLGANTPTPKVVQAIHDHEAELLMVSATISLHVRAVADLIRAVRAADPHHKVTIMVGGYPFQVAPDLWRTVGADLYARDAQEAVALAGRASGTRPGLAKPRAA